MHHVIDALAEAAWTNYVQALEALAVVPGTQLSLIEASDAAIRVGFWRDTWIACERALGMRVAP